MPRNGSGAFTRVHDWTADADAGIDIRADRMDEDSDDIAQALSDSISKDGQTATTQMIPFAEGIETGQIKFPSSPDPSADAYTLDDYREVAWTPTLIGTSTPGSVTYSEQQGSYTKIGRLVIARFSIITTLVASFTGNARIGGLPFPAATLGAVHLSSHGGITYGAGFTSLSGEIPTSPGDEIELIVNGTGVNSTLLPATGVANATILRGTAIYHI